MTLVKARIREKEGGGTVECGFNPTEYTITKGAEWRRSTTSGARTAPTPEFVGTRPRTLRMRLLFDAWAADADDVSADVDLLLAWTNPTPASIAQGQPVPPILVFHWGQNQYFDAYLASVDAQYTLFSSEGVPLRATATVALVEVPSDPARQNPTSGALRAHRTATVAGGESLQSIAHREYGEPALWRGLAVANAIDDPLALAVGARLLLPPRDEVVALS